ncbi:MAG: fumarylacetoacetase [Opitutae bacterium]|nr:fumarylacetoacetase [Opitutae bacterium]
MLNQTHDPARLSWVDTANDTATDFPLQNLPYGVFRPGPVATPRLGVAIGTSILDLAAAAHVGLLPEIATAACRQSSLNELMALGAPAWSALRARLSELLGADTCPAGPLRARVESCLTPLARAVMLLPAQIGDYTDFYASIFHATNVGTMLRPDSPLLPNYKWVPVGYHGRSSSIVVSGTAVRRPNGQTKPADLPAPVFGPCKNLDYELELAAFVGPGNPPGTAVPVAHAGQNIFGVVLLNDWSARDLQTWEYQPLGPFLAKNFASTISPWVVTLEALAPFRCPAFARPADDPAPLPHLTDAADQKCGGLDLTLEVWLATAAMRAAGTAPVRLTRGNFQTMYWTLAQLLAHHASNGCNLRPGDLLGSGTVSGPAKDSRGCLLELTWRGTEPLTLPNGEVRKFLADGDEVILRGYAERPGARRLGLGECRGLVLPAVTTEVSYNK